MARQHLLPSPSSSAATADEDPKDDRASSWSLGGMSTRTPIKPGSRSHPLLAPFVSLLSTLAIPIQLSSLALATPTLLLTVLEALLETRLVEADDSWRGSWEKDARRRLLSVLLEAITQVWEVISRRASEREVEWVWSQGEVDVEGVIKGEENEVAKTVEALLRIAEALGVVDERGTRPGGTGVQRTETGEQLLPASDLVNYPTPITSDTGDVFDNPTSRVAPPGLFAPRPLGPRRTLPPPAPSQRRTKSATAGHSILVPPPSPHRSPHLAASTSISATPNRSTQHPRPTAAPRSPSLRSPTSSTSFLALLSDPTSHIIDDWREKRPVPPLSPPKAGTARTARSVKEALKRQEDVRRMREAERVAPTSREAPEVAVEDLAQRADALRLEGGSTPADRPITPPTSARPAPLDHSDSSSSASVSERKPSPPPLAPCTCSASARRPATPAARASPSSSVSRRVSTEPPFVRKRRVRVTRLSARAHIDDNAFLSVHSSTDIEQNPQTSRSSLSPSTLASSDVKAPASAPAPLTDDSRPPALSPYTAALLAKRDALRAKLAVLERREADRRLLRSGD